MDSYDSDDDGEYSPGLPMNAIAVVLVGCALLLAAGIGLPYVLPRPGTALLFGVFVGAAPLLWLAALPLGLRGAGLWWMIGGIVALLAAGAGGALMAERFYHSTAARDASSFAEAEIDSEGLLSTPRGGEKRGTVSALYEKLVREAREDRRKALAAMGAAGVGALNSPYALNQNPAVLGNCGGIGALKAGAAEMGARDTTRATQLVAAVDGSGMTEELRKGMRLMVTPLAETNAMLVEGQKTLFDASEALCKLLARRTWREQFGYFMFVSAADLAEARKLGERRREAVAALAAAQRELRARVEQGREIVRDVLSR